MTASALTIPAKAASPDAIPALRGPILCQKKFSARQRAACSEGSADLALPNAVTPPLRGSYTETPLAARFAVPAQTPPVLNSALRNNQSSSMTGAPANSALLSDPKGDNTLVLAVSLDGSDTGQYIPILRDGAGNLSARAADLRALRLKVDKALGADTLTPLNQFDGLKYQYDEASQSLNLQAPDSLIEPLAISLADAPKPTELANIPINTGLLFNYSLFGALGGGASALDGGFEGLVLSPVGIFSNTFTANTESANLSADPVVRLDSSWRYIDPGTVRSYSAGDFITGAVSWSNAVRLGGFQIQSAFEQRPDIVTTAMPQFFGSAVLPSSLDVYVNALKIYSGQVPAGPFTLRDLPIFAGGNMQVVLTDPSGRQSSTTAPFYYTPSLLKAGLLEYSLDVGAPRQSYGLSSFQYDSSVDLLGTLRYGLSDADTLEGHLESSSLGLVDGGVGIVQGIGNTLVASFATSGSHYQNYTGAKFAARLEGQWGPLRGYVGTQRLYGDYFDLARLSNLRDNPLLSDPTEANGQTNFLDLSTTASVIDQASLSITPAFDPMSFSVGYTNIVSSDSRQKDVTFSASRSLGKSADIFANAFLDTENSGDFGAYVTLTFRLGGNNSASAGYQASGVGSGFNLEATGASGQAEGDLGWSLQHGDVPGGGTQNDASANYRFSFASAEARIETVHGVAQGSASLDGSVVVTGEGVFLANRVDNSFAIVRNAGPDTDVYQGGAKIARTDSSGTALLPNVLPYHDTNVSIDPTNLPDDWVPKSTSITTAAGYRNFSVVDFGMAPVHGAVVVLKDKNGAFIPPGYEVLLDTGGGGISGYDGQTYLQGLVAANDLHIDMGPKGVCHAHFAYAANSATPVIGPVICE